MASAVPNCLARHTLRSATASAYRITTTTRQPHLATLIAPPQHHLRSQPFSHSPFLLKKNKPAPRQKASRDEQPAESSSEGPEDPMDMTPLTSAFETIDAHFKNELQMLTHGGRFNPESLGSLRVTLKPDDTGAPLEKGEQPQTTTFPLSELAQIVPRPGRTVSLLLNDRAYIKPIMSSIQTSPDFNQQPQRSPDNELELLLKVEMERPEESAKRVRETCQAWRERVRSARTKHDKMVKAWKKKGVMLPDVVRMVEKEVQKTQDRKMKEIGEDEDRTLKQLRRG